MAAILADDNFKCIFNENDRMPIQIGYQESNWQYASIGSGKGLVLKRRQVITWTNADLVHWRKYATLGGDELNSANML